MWRDWWSSPAPGPGAPGPPEEARQGAPRSLEGACPADTLISVFWPAEQRLTLCCPGHEVWGGQDWTPVVPAAAGALPDLRGWAASWGWILGRVLPALYQQKEKGHVSTEPLSQARCRDRSSHLCRSRPLRG